MFVVREIDLKQGFIQLELEREREIELSACDDNDKRVSDKWVKVQVHYIRPFLENSGATAS